MKNYFYIIIFLISFSSCKWNVEQNLNKKNIVCTTTIVGDMVNQLLDSSYHVKVLMGAGVDPHMYEPKPSDVRALGDASVIIMNGLHLEGKMADLFNRLKKEKAVISFSDGINKSNLIQLNSHSYDPHIWFDVQIWLSGLRHCKNQLIILYPSDSIQINNRFDLLSNKMLYLDKKIKVELNQLNENQRVLITSHDAFHYFGKAYGIKVKAVQGVSTVTEPGLKNVSNLIDEIVIKKIPAIFVESSVSSKSIEAVIEGCKEQNHTLKIGGTLYSDALGGKNSHAATYLEMIEKNVSTFKNSMK